MTSNTSRGLAFKARFDYYIGLEMTHANRYVLITILAAFQTGCVVVSVVDTAASAVATTVEVAVDAVGTAVDIVIPD